MRFFIGLDRPSDAKHFDAAFISVNTIRNRKSDFQVGDWIMDSGAFTTIAKHGGYPHAVDEYAAHVRRWKSCGNMLAAVAQDYMCEPVMLERTGLTVADHQRLTIERYDELMSCDPGAYIMPVLQGYAPADYAQHVRDYGNRFASGAWVGVGSVCKRNGNPSEVAAVLLAIKAERPDLRLHGFGLKKTALGSSIVVRQLDTADSMAWSYNARRNGRNHHDWRVAREWMHPGALLNDD